MNIQDQLNKAFHVDDSDCSQQLKFSWINESRTSEIIEQTLSKKNIQDQLNTAFIVDDNDFFQVLQFRAISQSTEDMSR